MTEQRFVFGEVASLYDRHRPGYSEELVDRVIGYAQLPPEGRILEVGCGTGQATASFARRGYRMLCLEPSPQMAVLAQANLEEFARLEIVVETFEDWALADQLFHLVISAQAFHWVDPELRFVKAARAVAPGGALAIFGHRALPGEGPVRERIDAAYAECAPDIAARLPGTDAARGRSLSADFANASGFGTLVREQLPWGREWRTADYLEMMQTQSDHRMLPADQLAALLARLEQIIDAAGGSIVVNYLTTLLMARRVV